MKKIILIAAFALGTYMVSAQAPEKMSYQAVVRNATGQLIQNQNVGIRVSILQNSGTGTLVYSERLTGATNANGLVNLAIGSGTILSGTFASIDWSTGNYYLKTETDPTGGTNYTIAGTSQLLSVPYAMYAKSSGNGSGTSQWTTSGNNISNVNSGNVGIGIPAPTEKLEVAGKTKTTNLQVTNGAGIGKVMTSDALGNANWTQIMRKEILSIGAYSFVSSGNNHRLNVAKAYFPINVNSGNLTAPINLPTGAIISQDIRMYVLDNSVGKDYTISLIRVPLGAPIATILASKVTSGASTVIENWPLPITTPITIDNENNSYFISMSGDFLNVEDGINGAKIYYSYPVNN